MAEGDTGPWSTYPTVNLLRITTVKTVKMFNMQE